MNNWDVAALPALDSCAQQFTIPLVLKSVSGLSGYPVSRNFAGCDALL
jgi:hypothetical protein